MHKVALIYDFDKTLSTKDMQEYSLIPELGYSNSADFWNEVGKLSSNNKMDSILSYMFMLLKKSGNVDRPIKRESFYSLGKNIDFYKGVESFFDRINDIGNKLNLEIEHYIISSGMHEIIEGTSIYSKFKKVYACKYYYNENDIACWPGLVVNYTTKTQYIFRINKQILDENNDKELNRYTNVRPIPFKRMVYVGDGLTDVPSMKLVKDNGGKSIVVYNDCKENAEILLNEGRANFMCKADYREDKDMENLITAILRNMASEINLEKF